MVYSVFQFLKHGPAKLCANKIGHLHVVTTGMTLATLIERLKPVGVPVGYAAPGGCDETSDWNPGVSHGTAGGSMGPVDTGFSEAVPPC